MQVKASTFALLCVACLCHTTSAVHDEEVAYPDHSTMAKMGVAYPEPKVDVARVSSKIKELGLISDAPEPAVTRILFTDTDMAGRKLVKDYMNEAGLRIFEDAMGNIYGRWEGSEPDAPAVGTGSHCDAIPHSGMYDGVVGVLGAVEAILSLQAVGFRPKRSIDVIMFTSEEPTRFGLGCSGSRAMAGVLKPKVLDSFQDLTQEGGTFIDAARATGYCPESFDTAAMLEAAYLKPDHYSAFVELHIEQGPLLEREGLQVGLVTAIAAPATLKITFTGNGGHAGALLMPDRRDAGLAAAELQLAVENAVLMTGAVDTVGTVGKVELHPGAVNSVPLKAYCEVDIRDIDLERRDRVVNQVIDAARLIARKRAADVDIEIVNKDPPAYCAQPLIDAAQAATEQLGLTYKKMVSRAYHDSLFMAVQFPTTMIFIPCRGGVSHRPDEFSSDEALKDGVGVLALTLARLSQA